MNLQCRVDLATKYKAATQIARVLTEDWCSRELYCPACDSNCLTGSKTNSPAIDFECAKCRQLFQLKGSKNWNPKKVVDAGYEAMIRAIRADRTPNLLVLQYSSAWLVQNLMLIPRMFFSESVIEKRKPLGPKARRAGWIGCNILLSEIPLDGKITVISAGLPVNKRKCAENFLESRDCRGSRLPYEAGRSMCSARSDAWARGTSRSRKCTSSSPNSECFIREMKTYALRFANSSKYCET
jgi:type II restriction enzyme